MKPPERNLAWFAKHHFGTVRWVSFMLWASPAVWLLGEWLTQSLGINPLDRLLHFTGRWALAMLLISLAVTPVRRLSALASQRMHARYGKRLSDWNWIVRLRRQFGLFSFFYACLHVAIYVGLDVGPDVASLREDVMERPFIVVGLVAFVLLIPLAATSNQFSIRRLGRAWKRLHLLSHLIVLLAIAHFWMQVKVGRTDPIAESVALALLLVARAVAWRLGDRGVSGEVSERPAAQGTASETPHAPSRRPPQTAEP
jgi:sulfoxide reductase heme-binding subunit YedZ